jgi:hypothetical protein
MIRPLAALLLLAGLAAAQTYIEIGGYMYKVVAVYYQPAPGTVITAPSGCYVAVQEPGGVPQIVGASATAQSGNVYYVVCPTGQQPITTTSAAISAGANCASGQLVNVTLGASRIAACGFYTDFARAVFVSASWIGPGRLRVEVFRYSHGSVIRNSTPIKVYVYNTAGSLVAQASGTDYVDFSLAERAYVINVSTPSGSYLIYKDPPPPLPPQPPSLISSAVPAAVLVSALAIALLGGFMSEYAGGSLSIITAFTIAAIAWLALPSLGIPEALAESLAVLVAVIGVIAYARSRRD